MLGGVTILSANYVLNNIGFTIVGLGIFITVVSLMSFIVSFMTNCKESVVATSIFTIMIGLSMIFIPNMMQYTKQIEYKVLIDDSVSFNEFMHSYHIENVEGDIYTVTLNKGMED